MLNWRLYDRKVNNLLETANGNQFMDLEQTWLDDAWLHEKTFPRKRRVKSCNISR